MNWMCKIWPRSQEEAAVIYCMYEQIQSLFIRALRVNNMPVTDQFNGFNTVGPMNTFQWSQCEGILDGSFQEEIDRI